MFATHGFVVDGVCKLGEQLEAGARDLWLRVAATVASPGAVARIKVVDAFALLFVFANHCKGAQSGLTRSKIHGILRSVIALYFVVVQRVVVVVVFFFFFWRRKTKRY